jgi:VanZ family protein
MCYAASDEFHQVFVSGRSPLIVDVLIDTCGALAGILLLLLVRFIHGRLNLGRHSAASIN